MEIAKTMRWKHFAFGGAVVVAGLLIWLLLLLIAHGFGFSTSDTGTLLSVLGSIMGAVFAAAGIAVALIALFEQMQLRSRVEQLVEGKFSDLRAEYEEQIQNRIDGSFAFFQATDAMNAGDWRQAETLVHEALHKNPHLQGVHSVLGLRMSEQVQDDFARMLTSARTLVASGFQVTHETLVIRSTGDLPPVRAIRWLDEALRNGDNQGYRVSAELALMYGYSRAYDEMLVNLRESMKNNSSLSSYFQVPPRLMMLIYACNNHASIQEVMRAIDKKLPQKDEILQDLRDAADPNKNPFATVNSFADWVAVELSLGNTSGMPVRVRIFYPNKDGSTYAYVFRRGQALVTIPAQDNSLEVTLIPVEELLKQFTGHTDGMVLITRA